MFAFTRQEQRFLLFIIVAFFVGLTIKIVRQNAQERAVDATWQAEREKIYQEFKTAAAQETFDAAPKQDEKKSVSKKAITGTININTASLEELQILPRVGPATAAKIVDYRKKVGPFKQKADIQKVKSIGPKTFAKIEKYITVD